MKKLFLILVLPFLLHSYAYADPAQDNEFNTQFDRLIQSYNQYAQKIALQKLCYDDFSQTVTTQTVQADMSGIEVFIDKKRESADACVDKTDSSEALQQFDETLTRFNQHYNETWLADYLATEKMENTEVEIHTWIKNPMAFTNHDPHPIHVFLTPNHHLYTMLMNERQALAAFNDTLSEAKESRELDFHYLIKEKTQHFRDYLNLPDMNEGD